MATDASMFRAGACREGDDCGDGTERSRGRGEILGDRVEAASVTLAAGCNRGEDVEGSHATEEDVAPGDAGCE